MEGLTTMVSRSLRVSESEANAIINEQARVGLDMLVNDRLTIEDVEELMMDMGVESDRMEEFLLRMI